MNGLQDEIRRLTRQVRMWDRNIRYCRLEIANHPAEDPAEDAAALQGLINERKPWRDARTARVLQLHGVRVRGEILSTWEGSHDPRLLVVVRGHD